MHLSYLKKLHIALICLIAILLAGLTGTLAWYGSTEAQLPQISGSVTYVAKYFESGDGTTPEKYPNTMGDDTGYAYEIKTAEQFYNLAWLQYLGYFNQPDEDGKIQTTYFYLSADLDMSGYVLPPIGTTKYPFLGNFDGNGHTITGLTVTNKVNGTGTPIKDLPYIITQGDAKNYEVADVEIIGLFGVVGALPNDTYTYSSQTNQIKNLYIRGITVETQTSQSLIGIAAGYVNGTIENVGVIDAGIKIDGTVTELSYTSSLSDYSLVGYCTDAYKDTVDIMTVNVKDPSVTVWSDTGSSAGNAWGGSIDMLSLYNRLDVFRTATRNNQTSYVSSETVVVDEVAGTRTVTDQNTSSTLIRQYDSNSPAGSFSFSYNTTSYGNEQYIYLMGKDCARTHTKTVTTITRKNEFIDGFLISDGNGHYLNLDAAKTGFVSGASDVSATVWAQDSEGHIYTIDNETGYYYYLNADGVGSSSTDANAAASATVWTYTDGKYSCTVNGVTQYLFYDGTQWTVIFSENGYVITDGSGNYLTYTGTNTITNTTDPDAALVFSFGTDDGTNPSGTASTVINGTRYYLRSYNGTLELSTTNASSWSNSGNGLNYEGYYLHFDGANWVLSKRQVFYTISKDGNYLNTDGNNITNGTNAANATLWEFSSYGGTGTISTEINGTRYYLYLSRSGSIFNATYSLAIGSTQTSWIHDSENGTISNKPIWSSQYIVYSNGWSINSSTNNASLTITEASSTTIENPSKLEQRFVTPTDIVKTPAQLQVVTRTVSVEQADYPIDTWFPLSVRAESSDDYNVYDESLYPALANTGYVISGSSYHSTGNPSYPGKSGDIRVSRYGLSNISGSYSNRALTTIYTIDGDGRKPISDTDNTYKKYADSKAKLLTILQSDNSYVYGLHFMDAAISKDDTVTVDEVTINGEKYYNYDLPRHCIDFNLKEAGYINFFAGNYFPENTSFFSLHQIFRSGNSITEIKEISKVYANANANGADTYIYQYKDGTYSSSDPRGDLLFDLAWIWDNGTLVSNNRTRLFYFEIPANPGEYALGSVSGSDGAYLIYLDISANAQFHEYTVTEESFIETVSTYEYPKAVDFLESTANSLADIQPSAAISLAAGESGGTISYDRAGNTISFTERNGSQIPYVKQGVTVSDGTNTWTMGGPIASESATTEILTLRDYNTVLKEATITVQTTTGEGTTAVRYTIYKDGSESEHTDYTLTQEELDIIAEAKRNTTENYVYTGTEIVLSYHFVKPADVNINTANELIVGKGLEPQLSYNINVASDQNLTIHGTQNGTKVDTSLNNTSVKTTETVIEVTSSAVSATETTYQVIYPDGEVITSETS